MRLEYTAVTGEYIRMQTQRKRGRKSLVLVNAVFLTAIVSVLVYIIYALTYTYGLLPGVIGGPLLVVFSLADVALITTAVTSVVPLMPGQGGN